MSEDFLPYQEALDLKKLGFDEVFKLFNGGVYYRNGKICEANDEALGYFEAYGDEVIIAPTFSQAFRWFRKKHGLYHIIHCPIKDVAIFTITGFDITSVHSDVELKSYEEAELACLRKLIEIIKQKR